MHMFNTYLRNNMSTYSLFPPSLGRGPQLDSPALRRSKDLHSREWIECNMLCFLLCVL